MLALATDEDLLAIEGRELYWLPSGGMLDSSSTSRRSTPRSARGRGGHGHDRADRRQALLSLGGAPLPWRHLSWSVPMAIATATSLDVHVGGKLLFADVSFKLEPRDRMTLSGRNGAGKSTLLRVLAGELTPEAGALTIHRGAGVALHDQRPPRDSSARSASTSSPAAPT